MNYLQDKSRRSFLFHAGVAAGAGVLSSVLPSGAAAQATSAAADRKAVSVLPRFEGFKQRAEDSEAFWSEVRSHFTLDPKLTFLNNGTLGPAPDVVVGTRQHYEKLLASDPTDSFRNKELAEVRAALAAQLNAGPGEVSITHSTTEGLNIFAHGLDWKAGDEVILGDQEHFGAVEPYQTLEQRYGIKIVTVKLPVPARDKQQVIDAYAKAFTPRTRVLVVSHVSYVTGLVAPLRELADLAHKHGALISVDGAQSFGVLPIDVAATNIDHFAGPGQKWLLAGTGTGVNYVRKDVQPKDWPLYGFDSPTQKNSVRYERGGQLNVPAAAGISSALQFHNAVGSDLIEQRSRKLAKQVREAVAAIPGATLLTSSDLSLTGNLTTFSLANLSPQQVVAGLNQQEGIVIRSVVHGDLTVFRVSTHFYNKPQDVEKLAAVLTKWTNQPQLVPPLPPRAA